MCGPHHLSPLLSLGRHELYSPRSHGMLSSGVFGVLASAENTPEYPAELVDNGIYLPLICDRSVCDLSTHPKERSLTPVRKLQSPACDVAIVSSHAPVNRGAGPWLGSSKTYWSPKLCSVSMEIINRVREIQACTLACPALALAAWFINLYLKHLYHGAVNRRRDSADPVNTCEKC